MATPYDGKVGLWHVAGSWVGEPDIATLASSVKQQCPVADAIYVKTSNGKDWQGVFDTKPSMEINGPSDIAKWVSTLASYGLETHVWCVLKGQDIQAEIARVVEAASVPGVKSMILDVEPYTGYWQGTRAQVTQLMSGVRSALGQSFHIGISVDPRRQHYASIYPDAWRPYVNSVHPQVYWEEMRREPEDVLNETYVVWGGYGLPIYPVLQGYASDPNSIRRAQDLARSVRGATGLSYFRLGVIGPMQFQAINEEFVDEEVGPDKVLRRYGWEKIISPDDVGYRDGTRSGQATSTVFTQFTSVRGHIIKYKKTEVARDTVWAQWTPQLPAKGIYEISVYVPGRHATTRNAKYHIHGVAGVGTELLVSLNQYIYSDQWVPLVVYEFDNTKPDGGQVNLTDLTGESNLEIAFTAIRWRQVIEQIQPEEEAGFDPPVGTAQERLSSKVWPGRWYDATGYATYYTAVGPAYHTGADLNLPGDADRNTPVYTPADGVVTFSGRSSGTWGRLIVIRHDPLPDGTVVWSRLAHITNPLVKEGDRVERGQQVASIGNAEGQLPFHLHFDIAKTDILERNPGHWPGSNLDLVRRHYVDPRLFIEQHRPPGRV